MLSKGIRPDFYCAPILKTEYDRRALVQAAISGNGKFFLGTDSAPHIDSKKISTCGCAGIFSSPQAIPLLIHLFEEHDSLKEIENFKATRWRVCMVLFVCMFICVYRLLNIYGVATVYVDVRFFFF